MSTGADIDNSLFSPELQKFEECDRVAKLIGKQFPDTSFTIAELEARVQPPIEGIEYPELLSRLTARRLVEIDASFHPPQIRATQILASIFITPPDFESECDSSDVFVTAPAQPGADELSDAPDPIALSQGPFMLHQQIYHHFKDTPFTPEDILQKINSMSIHRLRAFMNVLIMNGIVQNVGSQDEPSYVLQTNTPARITLKPVRGKTSSHVAALPTQGQAVVASEPRHDAHNEDKSSLDWMFRAACSGMDQDLFFPERGASTRVAKGVCASCEVKSDCLVFALEHGIKFGIWGGMSERERRRIRRTS